MMRGAVKAGAVLLPALALLAPVRASSQETATWAGHGAVVLSMAVSPDGSQVASGDANGELRVWDAGKGVTVGTWPAGEGPVTATGAMAAIAGKLPTAETTAAAQAALAADLDPPADQHGGPGMKRHLAGVLLARALARLAGTGEARAA
jgi:hypothetical protein